MMTEGRAVVVAIGILALCASTALAQPRVDVGLSTATPGGAACVPVSLTKNGVPVVAVSSEIVYGEGLGIDPTTDCTLNAALQAAGYSILCSVPQERLLACAVYHTSLLELPDGEVFGCCFAIAGTAPVGQYPLSPRQCGAATEAGDVPTSCGAGLVEVVEPSPTPTATDTAEPTGTATPSFTRTETATATVTATATATSTPSPSPTGTATATSTPSPSPTGTATATSTPSPSATGTPTATGTETPTPTVTVSPPPVCTGDCDGDGRVTVDELIKGVNIALGSAAIGECSAFDRDGSGTVTIDELIAGVNRALVGC